MTEKKNASGQMEPRQKDTFRSVPQEAYLRTLTLASHLSRQVDELLRSFDISQPQYNVLRILAGAGLGGLGRNEISARMITTTPDMTRLLNRLEEKGWVARERGTEDRREIATTLTALGKKLLKEIDAPLAKLHDRQFGDASSDDLSRLLRLLKMLNTLQS